VVILRERRNKKWMKFSIKTIIDLKQYIRIMIGAMKIILSKVFLNGTWLNKLIAILEFLENGS